MRRAYPKLKRVADSRENHHHEQELQVPVICERSKQVVRRTHERSVEPQEQQEIGELHQQEREQVPAQLRPPHAPSRRIAIVPGVDHIGHVVAQRKRMHRPQKENHEHDPQRAIEQIRQEVDTALWRATDRINARRPHSAATLDRHQSVAHSSPSYLVVVNGCVRDKHNGEDDVEPVAEQRADALLAHIHRPYLAERRGWPHGGLELALDVENENRDDAEQQLQDPAKRVGEQVAAIGSPILRSKPPVLALPWRSRSDDALHLKFRVRVCLQMRKLLGISIRPPVHQTRVFS